MTRATAAIGRPIQRTGEVGIQSVAALGGMGLMLLRAASMISEAFLTGRGRRLAWQNLWQQMVTIGVRAIPIVCLVVALIGAIMALQMAPFLRRFGQIERVADAVAIGMFRELGPLLSAATLVGFAGASIAAELGTMQVGEEVDAMQAHAIDPVRFLVLPRIIATTVMMTCLAIIADLVGILGGMLTALLTLELTAGQYLRASFNAPSLWDFGSGMVKAPVFGLLIATIACYHGLQATGGASTVGRATTLTVVVSTVALIIVDLAFALIFFVFGL
ncbi:MAG: MlaE family ABC transporter permease [Phycisphaeraceae bacterium]